MMVETREWKICVIEKDSQKTLRIEPWEELREPNRRERTSINESRRETIVIVFQDVKKRVFPKMR